MSTAMEFKKAVYKTITKEVLRLLRKGWTFYRTPSELHRKPIGILISPKLTPGQWIEHQIAVTEYDVLNVAFQDTLHSLYDSGLEFLEQSR